MAISIRKGVDELKVYRNQVREQFCLILWDWRAAVK